MRTEVKKSLRMLKILRILKECTDSEHPMSQKQINDRLRNIDGVDYSMNTASGVNTLSKTIHDLIDEINPKTLTHENEHKHVIKYSTDSRGRITNMFYNDFDVKTYNFHTQYGRLQFSREASDKGCGSSNEVVNGQLNVMKTLSNYKDPMAYMGDFTKNDCLNGKWITVDDIVHNEKACEATAEAFIKYINEEDV